MTANLVNGLSSKQNLMPQTAAGANSSAGMDFSKVLDKSTAKETAKASADNGQKDTKSMEADKTDKVTKTEDKQQVRDNKTDTSKDDSKVTAKDTKEESQQTVEDTTLNEKDLEQVAEVVATMVNAIAEVLDIPVEEVTEAVDNLGFTETAVLDSKSIPSLVTEITGASDVSAIVTDEELFADVKELMETSDKLLTELSEELKVPVAEVKEVIADKLSELNETVTELKPETDANQNQIEEPVIEARTEQVNVQDNRQRDNNGSERRENNQNLNFGQTIVDTLKASVAEAVSETEVTYSTTSVEDIMNQVTESLKATMKEDITEMEMQLHPASLGNVRIQVAARDGIITANFTTQNEEVKQVLETQIIQLREQMNDQGIKVEAVEVTVDTHAFERNFNGEQDRSNGQAEAEAKKKRVRGINLSGMDMDELDGIDEEDRVTADMMAKQGNTVDYLA